MATTCDNADSVVATVVATKTPDKSYLLPADLERVIEVLPADLARVVSAWPQLSESLRQAVLAIVEYASCDEPRAGVTDERRPDDSEIIN